MAETNTQIQAPEPIVTPTPSPEEELGFTVIYRDKIIEDHRRNMEGVFDRIDVTVEQMVGPESSNIATGEWGPGPANQDRGAQAMYASGMIANMMEDHAEGKLQEDDPRFNHAPSLKVLFFGDEDKNIEGMKSEDSKFIINEMKKLKPLEPPGQAEDPEIPPHERLAIARKNIFGSISTSLEGIDARIAELQEHIDRAGAPVPQNSAEPKRIDDSDDQLNSPGSYRYTKKDLDQRTNPGGTSLSRPANQSGQKRGSKPGADDTSYQGVRTSAQGASPSQGTPDQVPGFQAPHQGRLLTDQRAGTSGTDVKEKKPQSGRSYLPAPDQFLDPGQTKYPIVPYEKDMPLARRSEKAEPDQKAMQAIALEAVNPDQMIEADIINAINTYLHNDIPGNIFHRMKDALLNYINYFSWRRADMYRNARGTVEQVLLGTFDPNSEEGQKQVELLQKLGLAQDYTSADRIRAKASKEVTSMQSLGQATPPDAVSLIAIQKDEIRTQLEALIKNPDNPIARAEILTKLEEIIKEKGDAERQSKNQKEILPAAVLANNSLERLVEYARQFQSDQDAFDAFQDDMNVAVMNATPDSRGMQLRDGLMPKLFGQFTRSQVDAINRDIKTGVTSNVVASWLQFAGIATTFALINGVNYSTRVLTGPFAVLTGPALAAFWSFFRAKETGHAEGQVMFHDHAVQGQSYQYAKNPSSPAGNLTLKPEYQAYAKYCDVTQVYHDMTTARAEYAKDATTDNEAKVLDVLAKYRAITIQSKTIGLLPAWYGTGENNAQLDQLTQLAADITINDGLDEAKIAQITGQHRTQISRMTMQLENDYDKLVNTAGVRAAAGAFLASGLFAAALTGWSIRGDELAGRFLDTSGGVPDGVGVVDIGGGSQLQIPEGVGYMTSVDGSMVTLSVNDAMGNPTDVVNIYIVDGEPVIDQDILDFYNRNNFPKPIDASHDLIIGSADMTPGGVGSGEYYTFTTIDGNNVEIPNGLEATQADSQILLTQDGSQVGAINLAADGTPLYSSGLEQLYSEHGVTIKPTGSMDPVLPQELKADGYHLPVQVPPGATEVIYDGTQYTVNMDDGTTLTIGQLADGSPDYRTVIDQYKAHGLVIEVTEGERMLLDQQPLTESLSSREFYDHPRRVGDYTLYSGQQAYDGWTQPGITPNNIKWNEAITGGKMLPDGTISNLPGDGTFSINPGETLLIDFPDTPEVNQFLDTGVYDGNTYQAVANMGGQHQEYAWFSIRGSDGHNIMIFTQETGPNGDFALPYEAMGGIEGPVVVERAGLALVGGDGDIMNVHNPVATTASLVNESPGGPGGIPTWDKSLPRFTITGLESVSGFEVIEDGVTLDPSKRWDALLPAFFPVAGPGADRLPAQQAVHGKTTPNPRDNNNPPQKAATDEMDEIGKPAPSLRRSSPDDDGGRTGAPVVTPPPPPGQATQQTGTGPQKANQGTTHERQTSPQAMLHVNPFNDLQKDFRLQHNYVVEALRKKLIDRNEKRINFDNVRAHPDLCVPGGSLRKEGVKLAMALLKRQSGEALTPEEAQRVNSVRDVPAQPELGYPPVSGTATVEALDKALMVAEAEQRREDAIKAADRYNQALDRLFSGDEPYPVAIVQEMRAQKERLEALGLTMPAMAQMSAQLYLAQEYAGGNLNKKDFTDMMMVTQITNRSDGNRQGADYQMDLSPEQQAVVNDENFRNNSLYRELGLVDQTGNLTADGNYAIRIVSGTTQGTSDQIVNTLARLIFPNTAIEDKHRETVRELHKQYHAKRDSGTTAAASQPVGRFDFEQKGFAENQNLRDEGFADPTGKPTYMGEYAAGLVARLPPRPTQKDYEKIHKQIFMDLPLTHERLQAFKDLHRLYGKKEEPQSAGVRSQRSAQQRSSSSA